MNVIERFKLVAALSALACTPDAPDLELATRASDSLTVAFTNSAAQRALVSERSSPPVSENTAQACDNPVPSVEVLDFRSGPLTLSLPADFRPIDTARVSSHGIHRWLGTDKSTIVVRSEDAQYHSGWTGLLKSECTVDIAGARAHIDLADASLEVPDYVVRGVLERPGMLSFVFEAHARNIRRQSDLLRALRTLSIDEGAWVVSGSVR
jgi:hypothetical protein